MKERQVYGGICIAVSLLIASLSYGQTTNIIKIEGNTAVVSEGTAVGIRKGDRIKVSRLVNGTWVEITIADVVEASYNMATISLPDGAPSVKLGDKAERLAPLPARPRNQTPKTVSEPPRQPVVSSNERATSTTPSRTAPRTTRRQSTPRRQRLPSPVYQGEKRVYLGPQIGAFIPVGDMADIFESSFGYGGIIGAQFRKNLDVCLQFFFTTKMDTLKKGKWSFWNLQLLGRRYLNKNILFDFGYGIAYPEYVSQGFYGGAGNIQLGLSLGLTYNAPLSNSSWFEMGALYQYYPNFAEHAGQFFTIQGRLLL